LDERPTKKIHARDQYEPDDGGFLARLREATAFEFAFGLEPIVQLTAWLFAAF
jgi:hypothetical protein